MAQQAWLEDGLWRANNKSGYYGVHPIGRKYYVYVWNPEFKRLLFLGMYATARRAASRVAEFVSHRGVKPYVRAPVAACRYGHVLLEEKNIVTTKEKSGRVRRRCRKCRQAYERDYYHEKRRKTAP